MTIWVDADSIPRDLRPILLRRAATRFVASKRLPDIPADRMTLVPPGPDAADAWIESHIASGDLVVTRDIPFAERVAGRGIAALNDRGDLFTAENAAERRSLRDRMADLRAAGLAPESPRASARTARDAKKFADALDRAITGSKPAFRFPS